MGFWEDAEPVGRLEPKPLLMHRGLCSQENISLLAGEDTGR